MVSGLERSLLDDLCCVEQVGIIGVKPVPDETGVKPVPPSINASKLKIPEDGVLIAIPVASVMLNLPELLRGFVIVVELGTKDG